MEALLTIFTLCGLAIGWVARGRYDKKTMLRLFDQALLRRADRQTDELLESGETDNATDDTN